MQRGADPGGPCTGYRVIDFTTMVSGPICTQALGDLGADVVKVEAPPLGDASRVTGSTKRDGMSGHFAQLNRNKRSTVIDLQRDEGREVARRLVSGADVVVENFRPGVAERLGIGYERLRALVPELVYVAISGFGPSGPYAELPAYDHIVQGLAGMMPIQGDGDGPRMMQSVVVDKATGLAAASAAVSALLVRERTGQGQRVDVPMLDVFAAYMLPEVVGSNAFPEQPITDNPSTRQIFRTWKTRDGHIVGIVVQDSQFRGFCRMVEREDLLEDERFAKIEARFANLQAFYGLMEAEFLKWPSAVLIDRARRHGAPFGPVHDFEAFLHDPQTAHNQTVFEVEDAAGQRMRQLTHPAHYARTPASYRRDPPRLGEHTDELLQEAGLDPAEIEQLRQMGAVR
jgi:crotonobetainyl-CoA:carnitine CoA-transferase CaiB-like acyl-CoA transferase